MVFNDPVIRKIDVSESLCQSGERDCENVKVCMVVKNQLWNDARVKKQALSLNRGGFHVTVIARQEQDSPERQIWKGITLLRPPRTKHLTSAIRNKVITAESSTDNPFKARIARLIRKNRIKKFLMNTSNEIRLYRTAVSTGAEIFHANDLDTLLICWAAAKKLGAKLVYDSHELWLESSRYFSETPLLSRFYYRQLERKLTHKADVVFAVTPLRGKSMKKMYPDIKQLEIILNFPEETRLPSKGTYLFEKLEERTGKSTTIVLYQGVICAQRGLEELLAAAKLLQNRDIVFAFVGHDTCDGILPRMAEKMDLQNTVFFLPPVPSEKLPEVTISADIGIILFQNTCLNHYYSLPNKLFEYMIAGIPVIASDFPEIAEVVKKHRSGILVDPSNPSEIASAIQKLSENRQERKNMGQRAKQAVKKHYYWETQEKKLLSIYNSFRKYE